MDKMEEIAEKNLLQKCPARPAFTEGPIEVCPEYTDSFVEGEEKSKSS